MVFNGAKPVTFTTSVVSGLELIASTSTIRICNDSAVKLLPWVFSNEFRIEWALICCSQTPRILLACGGLLFRIIQSQPFSSEKSPIFFWSISWKAHISSVDAPTKLVPLPDLIILTIPLTQWNILNSRWTNLYLISEQAQYVFPCWKDRYIKHHIS